MSNRGHERPVVSMVRGGPDDDLTRIEKWRQVPVSAVGHGVGMDDASDGTIRRAIGGDVAAIGALFADAGSSDDVQVVAVAAILAARRDWIERARTLAITSRDRQMVAIGASHLTGDRELVQLLARDHLSEHPGSVVVAWIASLAPGAHTPVD